MALPPHIPGTYSHREWVLFKTSWDTPWNAYNTATGEVVPTDQHHVERAKETLPAPAPTQDTAPRGRYTMMPRRTTASPRGWDVA